jgi:hypothetical protein
MVELLSLYLLYFSTPNKYVVELLSISLLHFSTPKKYEVEKKPGTSWIGAEDL